MNTKYLLLLILALNSLAIIVAVILGGDNPRLLFKEHSFITWFSFLQLLTSSFITWRLYIGRRTNTKFWNLSQSYFIWAIISVGFIFLSIDEIALIHENLDKLIHFVLSMEETGITDRIDDVIVGLYGIAGIGVLYYYRKEFGYYPYFKILISIGFIFMFSKVFIDFLHNRNDILPHILNESTLKLIKPWLEVTEGSCKILGEAFFMAAFYYCYRVSKNKFNLAKIL